MLDQEQLMAQIRKVQEDVQEAQEEIAAMVAVGHAAGESIEVEVGGEQLVRRFSISPRVVNLPLEELAMLEELLKIATNNALTKIQEATAERMSIVTGGLDIPGFDGSSANTLDQEQLMAQIRQVQEDVQNAQEEIAAMLALGHAAGESIEVEVGGDQLVHRFTISPRVVNLPAEEIAMLEELLKIATNNALTKIQEATAERMSIVTGGLDIPGFD